MKKGLVLPLVVPMMGSNGLWNLEIEKVPVSGYIRFTVPPRKLEAGSKKGEKYFQLNVSSLERIIELLKQEG